MSSIDVDKYTLELALDHEKYAIGLILSKDYEDSYFFYDGEWRISGDPIEEYLYEPGNIQIPFDDPEEKTIIVNRFGTGEDASGNLIPAEVILFGTKWEDRIDSL